MPLNSYTSKYLRSFALCIILGSAAQATVIRTSQSSVPSGGSCTVHLENDHHQAEPGLPWSLHVEGFGNGRLVRNARTGQTEYLAPDVLVKRTVRIIATSPLGDVRSATITLSPQNGFKEGLNDCLGLLESLLGPGWSGPRMTAFCEEPRMLDEEPVREPAESRKLAALQASGESKEQPLILLLDNGTLYRTVRDEKAAPTPMILSGRISDTLAVAAPGAWHESYSILDIVALPEGEASGAPRGFMILVQSGITDDGARFLCHLSPEGVVTPQSSFTQRFRHMALDHLGRVHLADTGTSRIFRLEPSGELITLAGQVAPVGEEPVQVDGPGSLASFGCIYALATDPATGMLFVLDANTVRSVDPAGRVTTILGQADNWNVSSTRVSGFNPAPQGGFIPLGMPCLNLPRALHVHEGNLLIADTLNHSLLAFNPSTRNLCTLVGGPDREFTAPGCLASFAPSADPGDCASIFLPNCVTTLSGTCILGGAEGLHSMEFPSGSLGLEPVSMTPVNPSESSPAVHPTPAAIMTLEGLPEVLRPGQSVTLRFRGGMSLVSSFKWDVLGGGRVEVVGDHTLSYTAPIVGSPREVSILGVETSTSSTSKARSVMVRTRIAL